MLLLSHGSKKILTFLINYGGNSFNFFIFLCINLITKNRFDAEGFLTSEESGLVIEVEGEKEAKVGRRIRMAYRKPLDHEFVSNQRWRYFIFFKKKT